MPRSVQYLTATKNLHYNLSIPLPIAAYSPGLKTTHTHTNTHKKKTTIAHKKQHMITYGLSTQHQHPKQNEGCFGATKCPCWKPSHAGLSPSVRPSGGECPASLARRTHLMTHVVACGGPGFGLGSHPRTHPKDGTWGFTPSGYGPTNSGM